MSYIKNIRRKIVGYSKEIPITELKPHQEGRVTDLIFIMKVPSGFIYTFYSDEGFIIGTEYVPANLVGSDFTCKLWEKD